MYKKGRLYSAVSTKWPQIAGGIVVAVGAAEFVVGGLTANSRLQLYIFAWATCTGGLWFMFEKAEKAISDETRKKLASMLAAGDGVTVGFRSIPHHFAILFDKVFGDKHWSRRCFYRSAVASLASSALVLCLFLATGLGGWSTTPTHRPATTLGPWIEWRSEGSSFGMSLPLFFIIAVVLNVLPDYVSLLETRWMIRRMENGKRIPRMIAYDVVATALIAFTSIWLILAARASAYLGSPYRVLTGQSFAAPFFYTAYFTSVWLWLYAASVFASRGLIRMKSGVGVLLSVTDVNNQPLRALGFTAVVLVSAIFIALMPLVLL